MNFNTMNFNTNEKQIRSGDFAAHYLPNNQTSIEAVGNSSLLLSKTYPGVPIIPTIGNNGTQFFSP
jgi:hypothetical protein